MRRVLLAVMLAAGGPASAEDAALHYHRLLDGAKANPAGTDWAALRAAYAAGPTYDPFAGSTQAEAGLAASLARNDAKTAIALADQALRQNWMDVRAQVLAALAYRQSGATARATPHQAAASGMIHALLATGNGASADSAIHVLATSEETVLLQSMHLRPKAQSMVQRNGHWLDILNVVHVPDGRRGDVYFNVDTSYAREATIATGRAKPLPDTELR